MVTSSETDKPKSEGCLLALLLAAIVCAACWLAVLVVLGPTTTAVRGEAGTAYFQCSGFVTSTRFWISGSRWSSSMDYQRHYTFEARRPDALARMSGDTLEVFSLGLTLPQFSDLSIPVRSVEVQGYEFGRLRGNAVSEGLTLIEC